MLEPENAAKLNLFYYDELRSMEVISKEPYCLK